MKLLEVLDKPAKWEWVKKERWNLRARFEVGGIKYAWDATSNDHRVWGIGFFSINAPADKDLQGVTGTGNEFEVFATVKDIFKDFIKTKPKLFSFETSDNSRGRDKLYTRFAKQIARKYGYKLHGNGSPFQFEKL